MTLTLPILVWALIGAAALLAIPLALMALLLILGNLFNWGRR